MSTQWDKYIVNEESTGNKWDKYVVEDVKKKDFSPEQLDTAKTSLQGFSEAPNPLDYEARSTTDKQEEPSEQEVLGGKIKSDVESWYKERGGLTPEQKLSTFNRIVTQKKSQYEQNIQANPEQADELLSSYNAEVDKIANEYGIIKEEDQFTVPEYEIKQYNEVLTKSYQKFIRDYEKSNNDPFLTKVAKRLDAGAERFLNIPSNVMAISETITNAVAEKLGAEESTYWQDRALYLSEQASKKSQEAQVGEGDIVAAVQSGDVGEAVGNLILDISEQVPQLLTLWAGNAAGVTNASLGIIGAQVGTEKFVQNKDLDIPDWINAMNSITSAGIELTTEAIGTVPLFNNMNRAIRMKGADMAQRELAQALQTPFERAYASVVGSVNPMVREAASEVAAELGTQIVDKYSINPDVEIGEGLADIAVSSAVVGKVLSSSTDYMNKKTREQIKEAYNEVPEEYSAANKLKATELILKIDEVKEATKGKNKILTAKYNERLKDLNSQLLAIAEVQDLAAEINDQISELDKEIVLAEEQDKPTDQFEKKQDELIKQRDELLSGEVDLIETQEAAKQAPESTKTDQVEQAATQEKEGLKQPEIQQEVKLAEKEVVDAKEGTQVRQETTEEGVRREEQLGDMPEQVQEEQKVKEEKVDYNTFKNDFLSDDVNLNQIDVPLKLKDRQAAAKNLREGKMTKQAEILESYLKDAYDSGQLPLVALAAGGKSVKTTAPIDSVIQEQVVVPPVESAQKPVKEKPKTRVRGVEQNIFQERESEQQKIVQQIVDENKETYDVLEYATATENAKQYIAEKGSVEEAYMDLKEETTNVNEAPTRQVARLALIDYYARKVSDRNVAEGDKDVAVAKILDLEKALAREATTYGQSNAMLAIWKNKQPESVLRIEQKKIKRNNEAILGRKIAGNTTVKEQVDKVAKTIDHESKKIADDIVSKSKKYRQTKSRIVSRDRKIPKKREVNKERIKKERDYRKERIERWKKERGQSLQAGFGFTTEDIEFAGDMIASYVREGYYRLADVTTKLRQDFKDIGIELTDEQIQEILAQEKDGVKLETILRKQEAKIEIPIAAKELGETLDNIIKLHWSEKNILGQTLVDKFMDEAGLTSLEANELADIVLNEYQSQIQDRSQKELTKLLGKSVLPKQRDKKKNVIDRIVEATNMGALDNQFYTQLFGEYFGLKELTPQESKNIIKLADDVQKLRGTGVFADDAALRLANYMYELYPKNRKSELLDTWIDMTYASLLSGYSTSILNMASAGSNIMTKPVRDFTNLSKWFAAIRDGNKATYNPAGEIFYTPALTGIKFGAKEAKKIYKKGGIGNKYIDQIANDKAFKISQLERPVFGEGKRFKPSYDWKFPVTFKIGGKKADLNIFNLYKYSGRNLLAQDKVMYNTAYNIEMASALMDKYHNQGLRGNALKKAVIKEVTGKNINQDIFTQRLDNDIATYEQVTGKKASKLDIELRKREIMLDMLDLTAQEKADIDRIARSNIFTDDRGGAIAHMAYSIGKLANSNDFFKATVKPFVPFTKIVGNVTEYMLDYSPFYGMMRANGLSFTGLYKKFVDSTIETAQMGDKGTREYYEQMGRAWMGTLAFLSALALGLGTDEDDWFQITGGYSEEGWIKGGRENVTPPYTVRLGKVMIPYQNIPSLAIPFALIGNMNDRLSQGMPADEVGERLTAVMLLDAVMDSGTMAKDMSIVQGVASLTKLTTDILNGDKNKWNSIGNEIAKRYLGFVAKPLPQNFNAVKQVVKLFDPTSYSRKDIKEILAYSAGIEHFVNNPSIDQLGDVVETYPGETLLPYTHWFNLKGGDDRWKFLAKYNAIPTKIRNDQKSIEVTDDQMFEKRRMTSDEFHDYTKMVGETFSNRLREYMEETDLAARNKERVLDRLTDKEITGVQYDVDKLRDQSKSDVFSQMFRWGVAKKEKPKAYEEAKKYNIIKSYQTSKVISVGVNGKLRKYTLDQGELYKYNTLATLEYLDRITALPKATKDDLSQRTYLDKYGVEHNVLNDMTDDIWTSSKKMVEFKMDEWVNHERYDEWKSKVKNE